MKNYLKDVKSRFVSGRDLVISIILLTILGIIGYVFVIPAVFYIMLGLVLIGLFGPFIAAIPFNKRNRK
jgi:hypothetical protein